MKGHGDLGAGWSQEAESVGGLQSLTLEVIRHGRWHWSRTPVEANW